MPLNKGEAKKILREKVNSAENSINSMEEEMVKDEDRFRKHMLSFHFGRLQQQFQEIYTVLKENGWI